MKSPWWKIKEYKLFVFVPYLLSTYLLETNKIFNFSQDKTNLFQVNNEEIVKVHDKINGMIYIFKGILEKEKYMYY